ncbi:hypothetical protein Tco_1269423 [Tanacetum coccineum]
MSLGKNALGKGAFVVVKMVADSNAPVQDKALQCVTLDGGVSLFVWTVSMDACILITSYSGTDLCRPLEFRLTTLIEQNTSTGHRYPKGKVLFNGGKDERVMLAYPYGLEASREPVTKYRLPSDGSFALARLRLLLICSIRLLIALREKRISSSIAVCSVQPEEKK